MTASINSTFDLNALGPGLDTALSGQVLTCAQNNLSNNRMARGTLGKSAGVWYFEACFYANNLIPGAPTSLAGLALVGIATGTQALNSPVGQTLESIAYRPGDGAVFSNNTSMTGTTPGTGTGSVTLNSTNVPAAAMQVWIGVLVNLNALTITFSVNGNVYATAAIPSGKTWFPAVTVCGPSLPAYATNCFINTGQRAFQFPQSTAAGGWYKLVAGQPLSVYLSPDYEGGFTSDNSDSPQNQIYAGRILNAESITIARTNVVWPWGQSGASGVTGSLTIDNYDGAYDWLLTQDMRDSQIAFKVLDASDPRVSHAATVATVIVDTVYAGGGSSVGSGGGAANPAAEQTITINYKDVMTLLQKPMQRKLFAPFDDVGVANAPLPITLGAVRQIEPMLYATDTTGLGYQHYRIHDAQLTALATVRDKGAPLDPYSSPPQYSPDSVPGSFALAAPPVGVLTCDASSFGGQVTIPGIADILGGIGGFASTSWGVAGSPPPGFVIDTLSGSSVKQMGGAAGGSSNEMTMYLGTPVPWAPANGNYGFHVHTTATWLQPGQSYLISCRIKNVQGQFIQAGPPTYGFALCTSVSNSNPIYSITPYNSPINVGLDPFVPAQNFAFVYKVPGSVPLPIYICMCATSGGSSGAFGTISNLVVEQLGAFNAQQQLPLQGIDLGDYFTEVLNRAQATIPAALITDANAITTAIAASAPTGADWSNGYIFGQHFPTAVMCDVALQSAMDSFCGVVFTDELGQPRVRRLVDPSTAIAGGATIVANYDSTSVQYGVSAETDYASGLTTQIGVRRDYKQMANTDLVTDYVAVPGYLRTQFARRSQFIQQSSVTLANTYAFAQSVSPLDSCLDDPTQGQFEIDRVNTPYGASRAQLPQFVTFTICYDGIPPLHLFGDIITLNYPRFGLNPATVVIGGTPTTLSGYPLVVKDTVLNPSMQTLQITAWG